MQRYSEIEFARTDGDAKAQFTMQAGREHVLDLYWLALLITGNSATAEGVVIELVESEAFGDSFSAGTLAWDRRTVIANSLAAIREELAASARETSVVEPEWPATPRSPDSALNKHDLECAVLRIDTFPRCALVLSFLEKVPMRDVVILLDADSDLVRKGQVIGLCQLNLNLTGCRNHHES